MDKFLSKFTLYFCKLNYFRIQVIAINNRSTFQKELKIYFNSINGKDTATCIQGPML
jgi:hypothetical protein